jgi:1-acyl-sn-glycerol-3-phosphate acyltransferase
VRRLAVYLAFTLTLVTVQAAALRLRLRAAETIPIFYHRIVCRIMGVRVVTVGTLSTARPTLWVSNHLSYLDIEVLGSLLRGSFVAKSEVAGWPLFGMLAKLQRTVFVDRKVGSTHAQRDSLQSRLEAGDSLILFPEGTSSDGNRTLPFKSALFAVAGLRVADRPLTVQPVSLACTALDGIPIGRRRRPLYAWYGDMDLAPHLWSAACQGGMTVTVVFHDPVTIESIGSRKALADHCWRRVALGLAAANAGRLETLALPSGPGAAEPDAADAGAKAAA